MLNYIPCAPPQEELEKMACWAYSIFMGKRKNKRLIQQLQTQTIVSFSPKATNLNKHFDFNNSKSA